MKFEHFALNVPDARASVQWYVNHLELRVMRSRPDAPYTTFLAEERGRVIMELYTNPAAPVPDYASIHPLCFHVAFVVDDPDAASTRLRRSGYSHPTVRSLGRDRLKSRSVPISRLLSGNPGGHSRTHDTQT